MSPVDRRDVRVDLNLAMLGDRPVRVVTADRPQRPLPIFRDRTNHAWLALSGELRAGQPRLVIAYASHVRSFIPSPKLSRKPPPDDYAQTVYGDAWDFDEGDQEGIAHWGDRPSQYGKIEVRDGKLIIPVTGRDPYFIWGVMFGKPDGRRAEHIDSRVWRFLRIRLRQSVPAAEWSVYVTDQAGQYRPYHFIVRGREWQTVEIDMAQAFKGFWDGRQFRALRIDPTNNSPGALVEIDWVRLEAPDVQVQAGPVLTRRQVAARQRAAAVRAEAPADATAGERALVRLVVMGAQGKPVPFAPACVALEQSGALVAAYPVATDARGRADVRVPVGTKAGRRLWIVGLCDDLGRPAGRLWRRRLTVWPGRAVGYELVPARRFVPVNARRVKVAVWAVDRFGNRQPANIDRPRWRVTGGAIVQPGPVRGRPAQVLVECSSRPLTTHRIVLHDPAGRSGTTELMTVGYKKRPVKLGTNGYLLGPDGDLFMPLGGFYANWPAGLPGPDGRLGRALDLFPCGPHPYPHGFPWSAEIERKVRDFLELCRRNGVTALRLMLRNMDLVGRVDEVQLRAVLHYLDLARPLGIRFDVVLFEDYDKPPYCNQAVLEKIVLPKYNDAQLQDLPAHRARFLVERRLLKTAAEKYTDRDAIECQKDYLRQLLPHLVGRDEIFCYELENEMVHPPMSWVNEMTRFIREIDPHTPVLGNPGPHEWPEPLRWRKAAVDLFSYHPYSDGIDGADHGAVVYMQSKWAVAAGKPMFTGEGGINQSRWQKGVRKVPPDYAARGVRDQIWLSLCCSACGAFMWAPEHEREMAEFGKVMPALTAVGVDLRNMRRGRAAVALKMPEGPAENHAAYRMAWQLLGLGVDFDVLAPADDASGYAAVVEPTASAADIDDLPRLFEPADGYQVAYLLDKDRRQALVYLRNVAGGIVNLGDGRPCWARKPAPATAALKIAGGRWPQVRAYDLDDARPVRLSVGSDGVTVAAQTTDDFVIGFSE